MIFEGSTGANRVTDESGRGEIFCAASKSGLATPPAVRVIQSAPFRFSTSPNLGPSDEKKRQNLMFSLLRSLGHTLGCLCRSRAFVVANIDSGNRIKVLHSRLHHGVAERRRLHHR